MAEVIVKKDGDDGIIDENVNAVEDGTNEVNKDETDFEALLKAEQEKTARLMKQVDKALDVSSKPAAPAQDGKPRPAIIKFLEEAQLSDEQFSGVIESKRSFVELINDFGNKVKDKTHEEVLTSIPGIVQNIVSYNIALNDINRKFFEDNNDLVPVKKFVSAITGDMVRKRGINDLGDYEDMLKDIPERIRSELGMSKDPKKSKPDPNPSGQVHPKGKRVGRGADANLTSLQKDIANSLEYLKEKGQ